MNMFVSFSKKMEAFLVPGKVNRPILCMTNKPIERLKKIVLYNFLSFNTDLTSVLYYARKSLY